MQVSVCVAVWGNVCVCVCVDVCNCVFACVYEGRSVDVMPMRKKIANLPRQLSSLQSHAKMPISPLPPPPTPQPPESDS